MNEQSLINDLQALIGEGQYVKATGILRSVLKNNSSSYLLLGMLSKCLFHMGEYQESLNYCLQAEKADPLQQEFAQIQSLLQSRAYSQASQVAQAMLKRHPAHLKALSSLAHIATLNHDPQTSCELLEQALEQRPANLALLSMLSNSYASAGYFAKAIQTAQTLVEIDPCFDSLWKLIGLQFKYGQYEAVLSNCEQAKQYIQSASLQKSQLELIRGQALRIMGNKHEAIQALHDCIELDENNADAWWALADFKDYDFSDSEKAQIIRIIDSQVSDKRQKAVAVFALAKAIERSKGPKLAMTYYHKANALAASPSYNPASVKNEFAARAQSYSGKNLRTQANNIDNTSKPIFIVGLPRSGSTLVEQMLASHPDIIGTMEQASLPIIETRAQKMCVERYNTSLSAGLSMLSQKDLSELGNAYLRESEIFRTQKSAYFIDKQPFNFRLVGLIHKILPNALIIDVRRHPLDCGYSLYKQYFHSGVDFSYRLEHIAAVYQEYSKLMNHWQKELPNKVYTLQYETLVHEPEIQLQKLLDHIGLDFHQNCIDFHKTKRNIHTASSEQVRQKLNKNSIGAWIEVKEELSALSTNLSSNELLWDENYKKL